MALNPIGLIVLGVTALVVGLVALGTWIYNVTDGFKGWGAVILKLLNPMQLLIDGIKFISKNGIGGTFSKISGALGFGDDEDEKKSPTAPGVISPQDRLAKNIDERRTTSTAEVTIKDETQRAQVTKGKMGMGITLEQSGAM